MHVWLSSLYYNALHYNEKSGQGVLYDHPLLLLAKCLVLRLQAE